MDIVLSVSLSVSRNSDNDNIIISTGTRYSSVRHRDNLVVLQYHTGMYLTNQGRHTNENTKTSKRPSAMQRDSPHVP